MRTLEGCLQILNYTSLENFESGLEGIRSATANKQGCKRPLSQSQPIYIDPVAIAPTHILPTPKHHLDVCTYQSTSPALPKLDLLFPYKQYACTYSCLPNCCAAELNMLSILHCEPTVLH